VTPDEYLKDYGHLRAEFFFKNLPVGTVLTDEDGNRQVFIGFRCNTAGKQMEFCETFDGEFHGTWQTMRPPNTYNASMLGTICRKFPELKQHMEGLPRDG
jgi:hypothetical protein